MKKFGPVAALPCAAARFLQISENGQVRNENWTVP